jgi:hypothetical protein
MFLDGARVRRSLAKLSAASPSVFGVESHRFQLERPLSEAKIRAFEEVYSISLPADYRHFLTQVGNGGAGPFYGVFPLGMMDSGFGLQRWKEADGIIGVLKEPFPLNEEWNDLTGKPSDDEDFDEAIERFDAHYFNSSIMSGAFPICHAGCALRIWLAVSGEQAGNLWYDKRAEYGGVTPLTDDTGTPLRFAAWYEEWLDHCFGIAHLRK